MTQFFKEKYPNKFETKDTSEGYRRIVLEKLNIHDENFISMLKKAISFEPINDIESLSQKMYAILKMTLISYQCRRIFSITSSRKIWQNGLKENSENLKRYADNMLR